MIGIYKITSPSGKIYIGQSCDIDRRFKSYKNISQRCKQQPALYNSLMKYTPENHIFEIEEILNDGIQENLNDREIFYIDKYKNLGFELLNIKEGGSSGRHSIETIEKCSKIKKNQWLAGVYNTDDYKQKMRNVRLGKPLTMLRKPVKCNETGEIFDSVTEAADKFTGNPMNAGNIVSHLKGRLKTVYKHTFSYVV